MPAGGAMNKVVSNLKKKLLLGAGLLVLVLVLVVGGWLGANLLLRAPEPEPLWTVQDLPALPLHADNGWNVFADGSRTLGQVQLPNTLAHLCDVSGTGGAEGAWAEVERNRDAVADVVREPNNRSWIELVGRSHAKPVFADACPVEIEASCPRLELLRAHQLAELALLNWALSGSWDEAFGGAELLAAGDVSHASSARTLIAQFIAFANTSRTLDLLEVLLAGYEKAGEKADRLDPAIARKLRATLARLDRREISMRRCLVGEYLFHIDALRMIESNPGGAAFGKDVGPFGNLLYDRGATLKVLNEDFSALMRFVEKPSLPPPERPEASDHPLWWMRNPIGKIALDLGRGALVPKLQEGARKADDLVARRDALVVSIRALETEGAVNR